MLNRLPIRPRPTQGSVLLEVVLALVLFVAAATVVSSALQSAIDGEERLRLGVHADNLAASVVAELETGLRSPSVLGPTPFQAPFTKLSRPMETPPVRRTKSSSVMQTRNSSDDWLK